MGAGVEDGRPRRRGLGADRPALEPVCRVGFWNGRDQRLRVGMARPVDDRPARSQLDHPPLFHDSDPVGEVAGAGDVVGDREEGHPALALQPAEERQDADPARRVDHRDRLVGDDIDRVADEGAGDADPLPLAARHRRGVPLRPTRRRP
jgi:hypothetical protein